MSRSLPPDLADLLDRQRGVISVRQAQAGGISDDAIRWLVHTGRWQRLQRGVYSVFTGDPPRAAVLWAAVLRAGPGAVLSHQSAAEIHRLTGVGSRIAACSLIHVTIPSARRVERIPGIVVHRSSRVAQARHPAVLPPCTRVEETVLDLVDHATTLGSAFAITSAACQQRLTTDNRLVAAMRLRKKLRWRADLAGFLSDIRDGVHSLLELHYVRNVERPHGLPKARRQARLSHEGRLLYADNLYDEFGVLVELDGRATHPEDRRWMDARRDNAALAEGRATLRYGWNDATVRKCATALQVGTVLQRRGWTGSLRSCGPGCPVGGR